MIASDAGRAHRGRWACRGGNDGVLTVARVDRVVPVWYRRARRHVDRPRTTWRQCGRACECLESGRSDAVKDQGRRVGDRSDVLNEESCRPSDAVAVLRGVRHESEDLVRRGSSVVAEAHRRACGRSVVVRVDDDADRLGRRETHGVFGARRERRLDPRIDELRATGLEIPGQERLLRSVEARELKAHGRREGP